MRALPLLLAFTLLACSTSRSTPVGELVSHDDAQEILEKTPWLDKLPQDERQVIRAYVFQDGDGLYFVGNAYKATLEAIKYWVDDDVLKLRFLDENKVYKTDWKIERYRGEIFEYKLTIKNDPRGPKVYYGFGDGQALPETVSKIKALAGQP